MNADIERLASTHIALPKVSHDALGHQTAEDSLNESNQAVRFEKYDSPSSTMRLEEFPAAERDESYKNSPSMPGIKDHSAWETSLTTRDEKIFLATLCWCMFLTGWNSGTLGPLIPTIQSYYHINYTIVSMLFISQCCGTIPGSAVSGYLTDKLGFGKLIALGAAIQLMTYSILSAAPPFPAFCAVYMLNGLAGSLQTASCNIFVASLPRNGPRSLGIMHAMFGAGALASPLVSTQFAQRPGRYWAFHYLTSLAFALVNNVLVIVIFRWRRQEALVPEVAARRAFASEEAEATSAEPQRRSKLRQILSLRLVHCLAFFIFVYVGTELTTGGWMVTYIQNHRHGGPSSGYVSSGFFGGLTLGRVALLPVNKKLGLERVVFLYTSLAIGLELTIWLVPSLYENAVAVSFVGVFVGPFYPIVLTLASRRIPRPLLAGSIGWISALGQTGSALFPFVTGAIASKHGIQVLAPVLVAMICGLQVLWLLAIRSKAPGSEA